MSYHCGRSVSLALTVVDGRAFEREKVQEEDSTLRCKFLVWRKLANANPNHVILINT